MKGQVIAIVPAAGLGKRFGKGTNKPFVTLCGKPLLLWALETLQALPEIAEIIPVVKEQDIRQCKELFEEYPVAKIRRMAPGGRERQDSIFNGLKLIDDKACMVLVHDGVRPLIEPRVIKNALQQMHDCDGVVVGVPVKDTVKEVSGGIVRNTPKRDLLWAVQTPQIFHFQALYYAYEKAMADSFYTTDDSALVERNGGTIKVVQGSYTNIKVTTPEDLLIAEVFLKMRRGES
ncbi:MAG: 2-C-methyl-D-erythritol 4-phosphate cytidylyltransferase [Nitrospirota bacterium]|nr:2-C-methyl-D-erythritol 4-phosphate cytidylyltransferase [Nitrospirota bacterium]